MIHDGEVAFGLVLSMPTYTLVDDREIVQHFVGIIDSRFEITEDIARLAAIYPERGDGVSGELHSEHCFAEGGFQIIDDGLVLGHKR